MRSGNASGAVMVRNGKAVEAGLMRHAHKSGGGKGAVGGGRVQVKINAGHGWFAVNWVTEV